MGIVRNYRYIKTNTNPTDLMGSDSHIGPKDLGNSQMLLIDKVFLRRLKGK